MRVPASKSLANRELVLSALADGRSRIDLGPLDPGDDVAAMRQAIAALGYRIEEDGDEVVVHGADAPAFSEPHVDARDAGTVARFGAALAALGSGRVELDGSDQLRRRPIAPLLDALRTLGAAVDSTSLPVGITGPLRGGEVTVSGGESSQFASALLLVAPRLPQGLRLRIAGPLVSAPFVDLTVRALEARGVKVTRTAPHAYDVRPQKVRARSVRVPGDATAATYPAAAAAILGGAVTVENVDPRDAGGQGDVRAFDLLERMGCRVERRRGSVTVRRTGALYGIVEDVRDCSDVFPTLAAIATCASTATELTGIGHTRKQESDRVAAVAEAIRAIGGCATEYADAIRIEPASLRGGVVDARGDHRIAMAFAILGLEVPGIAIEGAESVAKTWPGFFDMLKGLG